MAVRCLAECMVVFQCRVFYLLLLNTNNAIFVLLLLQEHHLFFTYNCRMPKTARSKAAGDF